MCFIRNLIHKIKSIILPPIPPESMEEKIIRYRTYGIVIGENCNIYTNLGHGRDSSLLKIGNNVTIAAGCYFLNHDNAIIKPTHGKYTDILGKIIIGNNCFIGAGCIILPGIHIADNCILGAGSVLTKSIDQEGSVFAGNPARFICTIEKYVKKNANYMINIDGMTKEQIDIMIKENPKILVKR